MVVLGLAVDLAVVGGSGSGRGGVSLWSGFSRIGRFGVGNRI